mgnify:FL=1
MVTIDTTTTSAAESAAKAKRNASRSARPLPAGTKRQTAVPATKPPKTAKTGKAENANAKPRRRTAATVAKEEPAPRPGDSGFRDGSKASVVVGLLRRKDGTAIDEIAKATGWQNHSVRGFLSGTLKKKHGLDVASERGDDGVRRYRIVA